MKNLLSHPAFITTAIIAIAFIVAYFFGGHIVAGFRRRFGAGRVQNPVRELSNAERLQRTFLATVGFIVAVSLCFVVIDLGLGVLAFIASAILIFALYRRWQGLNILLTKVEEATTRVVLRGGSFSHLLIQFKDRCVIDEEGANFLNEQRVPDERVPDGRLLSEHVGHRFFAGDIVNLDDPLMEEFKKKHCHPPGGRWAFLGRWLERLLGGIKVVGIPYLDSLYTYGYTRHKVQVVETPGESGITRSLKMVPEPVTGQIELRLGLTRKNLLLEALETEGLTTLDEKGEEQLQGFGFRFNFGILLTLRVVNPYKALFEAGDWAEQLLTLILPFVSEIVAETPTSQLVSQRDEIAHRIHLAMRGIPTRWTKDERGQIQSFQEVEIPEANEDAQPGTMDQVLSTRRREHTLGIIYEIFGLEVIRAEVGEIEATDPKDAEALSRAYENTLKAAALVARGKGEAQRYKDVLRELNVHPELAAKYLEKEAIQTTKGTVIFSTGGARGSTAVGGLGGDPMLLMLVEQMQRLTETMQQRQGQGGGRPPQGGGPRGPRRDDRDRRPPQGRREEGGES